MIRPLLRLAALLGGLGLVYAYPRYQREKQAAVARLRAGGSLFHSPTGALEYAVSGEGQAILAIHGAGGGCDQGLMLTCGLDPSRYQTVAVSRPGYRGTPLTTGRTPEAQADAALALLDHLGIQRAVVIGISAGGLASLQFAARHPDRCAALILVSAVTPYNQTIHAPVWILWAMQAVMSFDFGFWLLHRVNLVDLIAAQQQIEPERIQDPANLGLIEMVIQGMFPVSDFRDGTLNDIEQLSAMSTSLLENIHVPTLFIHGTNDQAVPYEVARRSAASIPGAKLVTVQDGSHFIFGSHVPEIRTALNTFLDEVG
jgi:2-hydroxy-6-oxonona-2,4-dienedioate hydrolase